MNIEVIGSPMVDQLAPYLRRLVSCRLSMHLPENNIANNKTIIQTFQKCKFLICLYFCDEWLIIKLIYWPCTSVIPPIYSTTYRTNGHSVVNVWPATVVHFDQQVVQLGLLLFDEFLSLFVCLTDGTISMAKVHSASEWAAVLCNTKPNLRGFCPVFPRENKKFWIM